MGVKVCKFGGSSMADASSLRRVAEIVRSDSSRKYVVVSAAGKRYSGDEKITDLLYSCAEEIKRTGTCEQSFSKVARRYRKMVAELGLSFDIDSLLADTEKRMVAENSTDFIASRGEYLSAAVMAEFLGYEFLDAEDIIRFSENGQFLADYTNDICSKALATRKNAVIPGFYGRLPSGKIKTFSRGGSDISGSIIARAANAEVYENWTDVNGFMTADPRIVDNPKMIEVLTYQELRELSYMGASVLHAESIFPVKQGGIPVNIRNTFEPENPGTLIVPEGKYIDTGSIVTGIAGRKDFTIILIEKAMMNSEIGFARKVLSVLEYFEIPFEHMPSGIDTLSVVIPGSELNADLGRITEKIKQSVTPDRITVTDKISLIVLVGHGMAKRPGTASRMFSAIAEADINIRMIDQGSSELSIIVGVENHDYEACIKAIYNGFLGTGKIS